MITFSSSNEFFTQNTELELTRLKEQVNEEVKEIDILIQKYLQKEITLINLQSQNLKITATIIQLNEAIDTIIINSDSKKGITFVHNPAKSNSSQSACEVNPESANLEASAIKKKLHDATDHLQNCLFESAKIIAFSDTMISKDIEKYGIKDQNLLFEIAKIAAANSGAMVSKYIQNYGIKEQNLLFEIAKIGAAENGGKTSEYIENFGIEDQNSLFEIAKIAAAEHGGRTSEYIQKYGIRNLDWLLEIAKIAVSQKGGWASEYIQNYGIQDQDLLFELAKIAATQDGDGTSECIQTYGIQDEERLFDIVKIAAAQDGSGTSFYINNYGIKDQEKLFQIAKIAAAQNGNGVSEYIQNYRIEDQDLLFEIAKIAAADNGAGASVHIKNYGIKDQEKLFEIAKISASKDEGVISFYIENYEITDQEKLFEIAKIAASKNGRETSGFIQNYGINDQDQLFEIAKISATQDGSSTSRYIQNYRIKNQEQLFEIAKIAAAKNGFKTSIFINRYKIKDRHNLCEIAKIALSSMLNPEETEFRFLQDFTSLLEILENYPEEIYGEYSELGLLTDRELTSDEIRHFAGKGPFPKPLECIIDQICSQKNPFVRTPLNQLLGTFLVKCRIDSIPKSDIERVMPIIQELFNFREPAHRISLLSSAFALIKDPKSIHTWQALFDPMNPKGAIDQKEKHKPFTALIFMFLAPLIDQKLVQSISQVISNRYFTNTAKRNPLIKSLQRITNEASYSLEEKQWIISTFVFGNRPFKKESVVENAQKVSHLLVFGAAESLKSQKGPLGLEELIDNLLKNRLGLDGVENCAEKFWSTFGSFRRPDALFTYAASLAQLPELREREQHITCLQGFARAVLEGTFPALRYSENPHLEVIFKGPSGQQLKDGWIKGARYSDVFESKAVMAQDHENAFNSLSFFKRKIIRERHLSHDDYADLVSVLQDPKNAETVKTSLRNRLEEKESQANKLTKKKDNFQLQLINLIYPALPLLDEELCEKMKILLSTFRKIYENSPQQEPELMNDLKGILELLKYQKQSQQPNQYQGWEVIDTDDPCDLLLLGTEVSGSCQRIDGTSNLNKCLLSYLIDGKNRAIVIKNKSGKIMARGVLRILWDDIREAPVLFQERTYPHPLDPLLEEALNDSFKRRARELRLPLLSGEPTDLYYPNEIHSLWCAAPSEYVDAGGYGVMQGPWSLSNMYLVEDFPELDQSIKNILYKASV
jgi:hypothetical protein